jgi:3-methylcrotonyl-CoA carboxylase alpha subunit
MSDPRPKGTLVIDERAYDTELTRKFLARKGFKPKDARRITAVIPGVIQAVHVKAGDAVRRGQALVVLEAMKMKNDVCSPIDATVKAVAVTTGTLVTKGQLLVELA